MNNSTTPQYPNLDFGILKAKIVIEWDDNCISFPTAGLGRILCDSIERFKDYYSTDIDIVVEEIEEERYHNPIDSITLDNEDAINIIRWFKENAPSLIRSTAPTATTVIAA